MNYTNDFTFSGKIFYLKEFENSEFSHSVKIRGVSQRDNNVTQNICEVSCLIPKNINTKNIKRNSEICVTGHIESWSNNIDNPPKMRLIVDAIF